MNANENQNEVKTAALAPTHGQENSSNETLMMQVELLIDCHGYTAVVDAMCEVCYAKANHIQTYWQDKNMAKMWEKAGLALANPKAEYQVSFKR